MSVARSTIASRMICSEFHDRPRDRRHSGRCWLRSPAKFRTGDWFSRISSTFSPRRPRKEFSMRGESARAHRTHSPVFQKLPSELAADRVEKIVGRQHHRVFLHFNRQNVVLKTKTARQDRQCLAIDLLWIERNHRHFEELADRAEKSVLVHLARVEHLPNHDPPLRFWASCAASSRDGTPAASKRSTTDWLTVEFIKADR